MSDSLQPHGLQHAMLAYSSPAPRACSNPCPLSTVMPSHPLSSASLLPSIFPSIRVFSDESVLHIRWPNYWSFSFSVSPSNECSGLISFRIDWFDYLAVQGTLSRVFSNTTIQKHQFFRLSFLYDPTLTPIHDYWKNHSFDCTDLCWQSNVTAF